MIIDRILGITIVLGAMLVLLLSWREKYQNGVGIFGALNQKGFSETLIFVVAAVALVF